MKMIVGSDVGIGPYTIKEDNKKTPLKVFFILQIINTFVRFIKPK
jgi:hypothetical protein